jgi:hypothetical protein
VFAVSDPAAANVVEGRLDEWRRGLLAGPLAWLQVYFCLAANITAIFRRCVAGVSALRDLLGQSLSDRFNTLNMLSALSDF